MAENLGEWPSKQGPINKIMPSDDCKGDIAPLVVGRRHKFPEFGCHLGNVAKVYFGAVSVFTNRPIMLEMYQNGYTGKLNGNTFPYTNYG